MDGSASQRIQAVFLVSPTYEGVVSDVEKIASIVHEYKTPLIVDEAHGAHFSFSPCAPVSRQEDGEASGFPVSALDLGADLVIQSLHKTLPSFAQTAVLHRKGNLADPVKIERYIRFMDGDGKKEMAAWEKRRDAFFKDLEDLKILKAVTCFIKKEESVFDWDISKVVISTEAAGPGTVRLDSFHYFNLSFRKM